MIQTAKTALPNPQVREGRDGIRKNRVYASKRRTATEQAGSV